MSQKRLLGLFATVAVIAAACGGSTATSAPASGAAPAGSPGAGPTSNTGNLAAEQILNVDIQGEPPTLDPSKAQDSNSITVLRALQRPLVYVDPKTLEPVPALAESW